MGAFFRWLLSLWIPKGKRRKENQMLRSGAFPARTPQGCHPGGPAVSQGELRLEALSMDLMIFAKSLLGDRVEDAVCLKICVF